MFQRPAARILLATLLSSSLFVLAACSPGGAGAGSTEAKSVATPAKADALLAEPMVGDLWAAELSHFSGNSFGDGHDTDETVYGLMKVIEVAPDKLVLVTEDGAWPKKQGAINDLRGDLAQISWDESEKITLKRGEIAGLAGDGKILETRRLAP